MIESAVNSCTEVTTVTKVGHLKDSNYAPSTLISKAMPKAKNNLKVMPDNKNNPPSLISSRDQESESTLCGRPSLASRRSRLLAHSSWQLANMLQKVSSLVSQSTYSVSLDSLLPSAKTKGFQMTPDFELDDDDNDNDIEDRENVPCGENNTIVLYIQEGETGFRPKMQEPKDTVQLKQRHNKIDALRERRNQNKLHQKHDQNKNDAMSAISAVTFDYNAWPAPLARKPTSIIGHASSSCSASSSNIPYLEKLSHHYRNISTSTNNHPSIDAKKMERFGSIHDRIMPLQIENHQIKEAYMKIM